VNAHLIAGAARMRQEQRLVAAGYAAALELRASKNTELPGNDSKCVGGAAVKIAEPAKNLVRTGVNT
jgi:hypothetical protein